MIRILLFITTTSGLGARGLGERDLGGRGLGGHGQGRYSRGERGSVRGGRGCDVFLPATLTASDTCRLYLPLPIAPRPVLPPASPSLLVLSSTLITSVPPTSSVLASPWLVGEGYPTNGRSNCRWSPLSQSLP